MPGAPAAAIFGLSGPQLEDRERAFFRAADPLGFILFARNCVDEAQVRELILALKDCLGRDDVPILIDQEGGRVQRLRPPRWRAAPAGARFAALATHAEDDAIEAAWLNARLLADELAALGITVDCAPVLDIPVPGGHDVIGDRAYGTTAEQVALLGRAVCAGLLAGGVLPVIKHIPGHGRASVDSHASLPVVDAARELLEHTDFAPFRALSDMPWAMTAHVVYAAIDAGAPATTSPRVIAEVVRGWIGFDGVLVSDDLCMRALAGTPGERAALALAAGVDVLLHCNGDLAEMEAIAAVCPRLGERRVAAARPGRGDAPGGADERLRPACRRGAGGCPAGRGGGLSVAEILVEVSVWVLPVLFAVTFHEAAHGWVAWRLGDDTAYTQGRVSFNPLRHIDPFGTVLMPAMLLLLSGGRFMFGFAKPVPVNFHRLNNPRRDMAVVAAAGPGINFAMALAAAFLIVPAAALPGTLGAWTAQNLANAVWINILLAIFNLLPLPPLDGGRIAVSVLPNSLAVPLQRLERYGLVIVLGLVFLLPFIGAQAGLDLNVFGWLVVEPARAVERIFLTVGGVP